MKLASGFGCLDRKCAACQHHWCTQCDSDFNNCWHRSALTSWICPMFYRILPTNPVLFVLFFFVFPFVLFFYVLIKVLMGYIMAVNPCVISLCAGYRKFKSEDGLKNVLLKIAMVFYSVFIVFPFFMFYGLSFDVIIMLAGVVSILFTIPGYALYVYYGIHYMRRPGQNDIQFQPHPEQIAYDFITEDNRVTGV